MPLITILLFGILAASFALIFELLLPGLDPASLMSSETLFPQTLIILLGIALIEESSKYIFLRQYALRFLLAKQLLAKNIFLLGISFGVGFSTLEILLIQNEMLAFPYLAALGTACLHIATSIIFAFSLLSSVEKRFPSFLVLLIALLLHTLYNVVALAVF